MENHFILMIVENKYVQMYQQNNNTKIIKQYKQIPMEINLLQMKKQESNKLLCKMNMVNNIS